MIPFYKKLDISEFCDDIYLHQANIKNLNNARNKISTFKLYDITKYLSLYYFTTKKYKIQQVKLEQNKAKKQALFNQFAKTTM